VWAEVANVWDGGWNARLWGLGMGGWIAGGGVTMVCKNGAPSDTERRMDEVDMREIWATLGYVFC